MKVQTLSHDRFDHSSIKDFTAAVFLWDSLEIGRPGGGVFLGVKVADKILWIQHSTVNVMKATHSRE